MLFVYCSTQRVHSLYLILYLFWAYLPTGCSLYHYSSCRLYVPPSSSFYSSSVQFSERLAAFGRSSLFFQAQRCSFAEPRQSCSLSHSLISILPSSSLSAPAISIQENSPLYLHGTLFGSKILPHSSLCGLGGASALPDLTFHFTPSHPPPTHEETPVTVQQRSQPPRSRSSTVPNQIL